MNRSMPTCPNCQHNNCRKDGSNKGKQRYYCKHCGYRHTVSYTHKGYSEEVKRMALQMYLEGLGFRSLELFSCGSISLDQAVWWKSSSWDTCNRTERGGDGWDARLHRFKKNTCWVWITVDRLGDRFLNVVIGSHATETGQCLWEGIAHHHVMLLTSWRMIGNPIKPFCHLTFIHNPKLKPLPLKGITGCLGISWLGYAVSLNVILNHWICCFILFCSWWSVMVICRLFLINNA